MRILRRILSGLWYVGIIGAFVLGFTFMLTLVFGGDSSIFSRVTFGAIAIFVFLIRFLNDEEVAKTGEDNKN